jgi:uncharacterized damage-inducible protein DinB
MGNTMLTDGGTGQRLPRKAGVACDTLRPVEGAVDDLAQAVIDEFRGRMTKGFPEQVRACLDALSEEQIWWRPNAGSNSVGNLVLHLCGSTRHFLGRAVGGTDYRRDRPAEFAEKGPIPRERLRALLDETVAETSSVLESLTPARLLEVTDRAGEPFTILNLLLRTSHHWAVHVGQMVYAAKALQDGVFDELWMKTMLKTPR